MEAILVAHTGTDPMVRWLSATQGSRGADSGPRRSGEHALERRAIRRLAVRGQHELDRQVEKRTEP